MANPERVALLTAALRSGRFQQGIGKLSQDVGTSNEQHCCLGVACIIAMENGLHLDYLDHVNGTRYYLYDNWNEDQEIMAERDYANETVLPELVRAWYGFPDTNPLLKLRPGSVDYAAEANDGGASFAVIADAFDNTYVHAAEVPEEPHGVLEP